MQTTKPTQLRRRKPGDIGQLKRVLWGSLLELEAIILADDDPVMKVKASHALGTLAGSYVKCLEVGDHAERLAAIEEAMGGNIHAINRRTA